MCSRLLTSTKRIRATIVIQTAWREVLAFRTLQLRALAKRTAEQCAAVANARDRILWAKSVIVKWWRRQNQKKRKKSSRSRRWDGDPSQDGVTRRERRGTRSAKDGEEISDSAVGEQEEKAPRLPKRQCALLIGFSGTGFNGMQMCVECCTSSARDIELICIFHPEIPGCAR